MEVFQFYDSPIKRNEEELNNDLKNIRFNSMIVRLKEKICYVMMNIRFNFNSMIVRLKGV